MQHCEQELLFNYGKKVQGPTTIKTVMKEHRESCDAYLTWKAKQEEEGEGEGEEGKKKKKKKKPKKKEAEEEDGDGEDE